MQVMLDVGVSGSKLHTALGLLGQGFTLAVLLLTVGLILTAKRRQKKNPKNG